MKLFSWIDLKKTWGKTGRALSHQIALFCSSFRWKLISRKKNYFYFYLPCCSICSISIISYLLRLLLILIGWSSLSLGVLLGWKKINKNFEKKIKNVNKQLIKKCKQIGKYTWKIVLLLKLTWSGCGTTNIKITIVTIQAGLLLKSSY